MTSRTDASGVPPVVAYATLEEILQLAESCGYDVQRDGALVEWLTSRLRPDVELGPQDCDRCGAASAPTLLDHARLCFRCHGEVRERAVDTDPPPAPREGD